MPDAVPPAKLESMFPFPTPPATAAPRDAAEELPPPDSEISGAAQPEIAPGPREFAVDDTDAGTTRANLLLRAARNAVALHDITEALARFAELLDLEPKNHQVRAEYAGLLLQAERYPDARRQLESLVATQGQVADYRLALADLLLKLKEHEAARDHLRVLLSDRLFARQAAIRIARTFVADHQLNEARQVFDAHIDKTTSMTVEDKRAMAQLLLDLERPDEAQRMLAPLNSAEPEDEKVAALLILSQVRMNQRVEALAMIEAIAQHPLKDTGLWLELALELYNEYAHAEAAAILRCICRQEPDYRRAKLALARTLLRLYEVDEARHLLNEFQGDLSEPRLSAVVIDYHTVVGEYSQAISLANLRLRDDPADVEAGLLLGNAYLSMRNFALAESAYCAALERVPVNAEDQRRELLGLLARSYFHAQRFDQAMGVLETLLADRPTDIAVRILLIETLIKMRGFDAAEVLTRGTEEQNPRQRFDLNVQWGYVLLEQGRMGEAANEFALLAANPNGHLPDVAYGLYRAGKTLAQPQVVREALALGPSPLAPTAAWAIGFSDRAMTHCDCRSAAAVLDDALLSAPKNVVLLIHRGEAAQLCDRSCQPGCFRAFPKIFAMCCQPCDAPYPRADGWFRSALHESPTNIRARLGLARSLGKHLEYEAACAEYHTLLGFVPQDVNIIRDHARMVEGWRGIERAGGLYVQGQANVAQGDAPAASSAPAAVGLGASKLVEPAPGEPPAVPASGLLATEFRAKYLRGWRFDQAVPVYQGLIELEPTNEAALFDLGQTQSSLNRTHCAIDAYQQLLDVNPCHQDAATALVRNRLELRPKVTASFDFEDQRGRQGLANITWENYTVSERQPLGDENEFVEIGYTERVLRPTDDRADVGEVPFVRWQEKFAGDLLLFADVNLEQYQYGLNTRPTFKTGVNMLTPQGGEVRFSGFLQNYYVNGEAIRQDIYTAGVQLNLVARPLRLWTLSGYYRVATFSDHNVVNWLNLNSAHVLVQGRRQVRGLVNYDLYSFQHSTVFGTGPDPVIGAEFPYWSPSGYSFVTAGLELKEWLSCDTFKGGNQHWYSVFFGGAVDSHGIGYFFSNSRWERDISAQLTWTVETNLIRSPNQVYDAVGVATYAVLRFR